MELKHWLISFIFTAGVLSFTQNSFATQSSETPTVHYIKPGLTEIRENVPATEIVPNSLRIQPIPLFSWELLNHDSHWFTQISGLQDDGHSVLTENLTLVISKRIENDKDFKISPDKDQLNLDEVPEEIPSKDDTELSVESELDEAELEAGLQPTKIQETEFGNLTDLCLDLGIDLQSDHISEKCEKTSIPQMPPQEIKEFSSPDIHVYTNKRVEAFIRLYTVRKRYIFEKALERIPTYQTMISRILEEHELPQNLIYLAIVESNLNPKALSHASALGLWQFMSYTGKHYGLSRSWWHDDRYDPEKSTVAAATYLKNLHKRFNGDWELALAAYNSGSGTVRRAIRKAKRAGKPTDFWSLRLPRETRGYVPAFMAVSIIFNNLEKYGFQPVKPSLPEQPYQWLDVGGGVSLKEVAGILQSDYQTLKEINPNLRFKGLTPPTMESFKIRIPDQLKVEQPHLAQLTKLKSNRHTQWKVHKVRQGDSLWSISRYYQIPLSKILDYNRIRKSSILRIGQKLMLPIPNDWERPKVKSKTDLAKSDIRSIPGVMIVHTVKKGETLWQISQHYSVSIAKIKKWNRRVLRRKYLKVGTEIVLKVPASRANSISM